MAIGIKETKELLKFVVEVAEAIDVSLADGEITFGDITNLVSAMMTANDAFSNIKAIPAEMSDLTEAEALELYTYAKTELSLSNAKSEEIVECALEVGLKLYQLLQLQYLSRQDYYLPPKLHLFVLLGLVRLLDQFRHQN